MKRVCDECGLEYDDVYRWTYCPHDHFPMNTLVSWVDEEGVRHEHVATSVDELKEFLE